jgi:hypothetical protein
MWRFRELNMVCTSLETLVRLAMSRCGAMLLQCFNSRAISEPNLTSNAADILILQSWFQILMISLSSLLRAAAIYAVIGDYRAAMLASTNATLKYFTMR